MPWSEAAQDIALRAVFSNPLFVGLTIGGREINDEHYERQVFLVGDPTGIGRRTLSNIAEIRFPPFQADAPGPIDGFIIQNRDGETVVLDKVPRPRQLDAGEEAVFRVGELVVGLT